MIPTKRKRGPKPRPRLVASLEMPPEDHCELAGWRDAALDELAAAPAIPGDTRLNLRIGLPISRRPLESIVMPIVGLLAAAQIVDSATAIADWIVKFDKTVPAGSVKLDLRGTSRPENRIGSQGRSNVARAQRERHQVNATPRTQHQNATPQPAAR